MNVEQVEEVARKLAAAIEEALGRITIVCKLPSGLPAPKDKMIEEQEKPGS